MKLKTYRFSNENLQVNDAILFISAFLLGWNFEDKITTFFIKFQMFAAFLFQISQRCIDGGLVFARARSRSISMSKLTPLPREGMGVGFTLSRPFYRSRYRYHSSAYSGRRHHRSPSRPTRYKYLSEQNCELWIVNYKWIQYLWYLVL